MGGNRDGYRGERHAGFDFLAERARHRVLSDLASIELSRRSEFFKLAEQDCGGRRETSRGRQSNDWQNLKFSGNNPLGGPAPR